MKLIKTLELNCKCFEDIALEQGITINTRKEIATNEAHYDVTTKDGRHLYVKEVANMYDCDAYVSKIEVYEK